jgi:signal transduction histidine kinase
VREAIDGLRLGVEAPGQIAARLGEYAAEFARQTGLEVDYRADPPGLATEPAAGLHLLRIAQEALTNVRKHAQARRVEVRLAQCGDEIELTITDDGRGFPEPAPGAAARRSYGLTTMRERAAGLGGSLTVATVPGQGTRISATLPGKIRV